MRLTEAMDGEELEYNPLKSRLAALNQVEGLEESAQFLVWVLTNIFRLEETTARDAVCDRGNDKGIDGIYVDENEESIYFFQAKIRQNPRATIGDKEPKALVGSLSQFHSQANIESVLASNANDELKKLIRRTRLAHFVAEGYKIVGIYVSNALSDDDSRLCAEVNPNLVILDRLEIASRHVDVAPSTGKREFVFDTSYVEPLSMTAGAPGAPRNMFVFPAQALQLVHMEGISDGSLFQDNVRYALGSTAVNRSIRNSIADQKTHPKFVLFHNGIIVLCTEADASVEGKLTVRNYSVVNGAQSLTSFYSEKSRLSGDLRVLVRVVVLRDDELARMITENSNNQNAIKPRDLRSNHPLMLRLQQEMSDCQNGYFFEIKRGERVPPGLSVISNDSAGRALLAFDLLEPWSAHQVYKVFDEKYSDIFGRPEVTAQRIVFVQELMEAVDEALSDLENRSMASYTLTRYFLLFVLSKILRNRPESYEVIKDPGALSLRVGMESDFVQKCSEILKTIVIDLNYETNALDFDYKTVLKSPTQCAELAKTLLSSYDKDVARGKAESFAGWTSAS